MLSRKYIHHPNLNCSNGTKFQPTVYLEQLTTTPTDNINSTIDPNKIAKNIMNAFHGQPNESKMEKFLQDSATASSVTIQPENVPIVLL